MKTSIFALLWIGVPLSLVHPPGTVPEPSSLVDACALADSRPDSVLGACCHPINWECFMFTEEQCKEIEGMWLGPGVTCGPDPP